MRKWMAILVVCIGVILSSCESGKSTSEEMRVENLPKRKEAEVGGKMREPMREGDWVETEKEKDNWSGGWFWGNGSGGTHASSAGIAGIPSVDGFEPGGSVGIVEWSLYGGGSLPPVPVFIKWKVTGRRNFARCRLNG